MAHDRQYKDNDRGYKVLRWDFPKKGESYWNGDIQRVVVATKDMLSRRFNIVEKGN